MNDNDTPRRRKSDSGGGFVTILGITALVIICGLCCGIYSWASEETQTCTVTEKDRAKNSSGGSDMRLYTEECGVLQVGDTWTRGNWDSADDYAAFEEGQTYEITTVGWRIPFLSTFPTVIEFHLVD